MHDSAYRIGELVMRTYSDLPNAKILEVGSLNVNGCLRDAAEPTTHYIGLDLEEGPSVDLVIVPGADFPVEDDSFDLVMASSVFEHDSRFWDTFVRMCRAARPGGHIYINAPSNGTVHRYPRDCWRFYPDAGLALAEHARSEGLEIDLIESFIGDRHADVWNDFVAVFRKGPSPAALNTAFVYCRYPSRNARTWQSRAVYKESDATEDMSLIADLRSRWDNLTQQPNTSGSSDEIIEIQTALKNSREQLDQTHADNVHLLRQVATLEKNLEEQQVELNLLSEALSEREQKSDRADAENAKMIGQIATLESNLRQRQEEIEQAWSQVNELTTECGKLRDRVETLETAREELQSRLMEANGWVFNLAGERRALEQRLEVVNSELERAHRALARMEAVADFKQKQLEGYGTLNRRVLAGLARLQGLETAPEVLHAQTGRLQREWREEDHPLADLAGLLHAVGQSMHSLTIRKPAQKEIEGEKQALSENLATVLGQKAALHRDVEQLIERLEDREFALRDAQERVAALTGTLEALRLETTKKLDSLQAESQQNADAVSALRLIIVEKDAALFTLEKSLVEKDRELTWLRRLYEFIEAGWQGWKDFLPGRRKRMALTLQRNGHFDAEAYVSRYSDVAEAGMDPLRHYVLYGMSEGRLGHGEA